MQRILVVTPTYNEADNIESFIGAVLSQNPAIDVLVVDDNSPDRTGDIVESMSRSNPRVHLLRRAAKMGLGTAYVAGFKYAIQHHYDLVFEMDADFSHSPDDIQGFLKDVENNDLVLGSRYKGGVRVVNWPIRRLILSYGANVYTRVVTGMHIKDATSGFKCFRIEVLKAINLEKIHSNGYAFQIEMTYKAWKKGFRVVEHPIIFVDRRSGISKMSRSIVYEAAFMVWKLKFQSFLGKLN